MKYSLHPIRTNCNIPFHNTYCICIDYKFIYQVTLTNDNDICIYDYEEVMVIDNATALNSTVEWLEVVTDRLNDGIIKPYYSDR